MNRSDSNEYANFRIEENVVVFEYKGGVMIDLKAAEMIVHDRVKFQEGKPYPVLCDTRLLSDTDKEARDYLAKEGSFLATAVALLVAPPVSNAITDFYMRTSKPDTPTRTFTDKYSAMKFLREFKSN